jgi:hypothetical protein
VEPNKPRLLLRGAGKARHSLFASDQLSSRLDERLIHVINSIQIDHIEAWIKKVGASK